MRQDDTRDGHWHADLREEIRPRRLRRRRVHHNRMHDFSAHWGTFEADNLHYFHFFSAILFTFLFFFAYTSCFH